MAVLIVAAAIIAAITSLVAWVHFLKFCRYLVDKTGDAASLKHAATAAQAFRAGAPAALAQALAKLLTLRGR